MPFINGHIEEDREMTEQQNEKVQNIIVLRMLRLHKKREKVEKECILVRATQKSRQVPHFTHIIAALQEPTQRRDF